MAGHNSQPAAPVTKSSNPRDTASARPPGPPPPQKKLPGAPAGQSRRSMHFAWPPVSGVPRRRETLFGAAGGVPQPHRTAPHNLHSRPPRPRHQHQYKHQHNHRYTHPAPAMVVRLRLARFGRRHAPVYNIVVAHARSVPLRPPALTHSLTHSPLTMPQNSARLPAARSHRSAPPPPSRPFSLHTRTHADEQPGTYDPVPKPPADGIGRPTKDIQLDTARAKYWLGVGAQPSDTVWRLFSLVWLFVFVFVCVM